VPGGPARRVVVILSISDDVQTSGRAKEALAVACVEKRNVTQTLLSAIRQAVGQPGKG
jgi:hypothetical protein